MCNKKHILIGLALLFLPLFLSKCVSLSALSSSDIKIDLMYMIDVSGSMIGLPPDSGAKDIFPKVTEALKEHIKTLKTGTRVFIFTFADGPHDVDGAEGLHYQPMWVKEIREASERSDKEEIERYVGQLNQDVRESIGHGWETAIYDSVKIALERFDKLREGYEKTHPGEKYKDLHIQKIILFTDGKDTRSKQWDFERFLNEFNFRRAEDKMGDHIFLKIISLGEHVFSEEEREKVQQQSGIEIKKEPEPEKEIIIEPPTFSITPSKISFDGLKKGATKHQEFVVKAENLLKSKTLDIILEGVNKELIDVTLNPSTIHLSLDQSSATFTLEIKVKKSLSWWKSSKAEILIHDPGEPVARATITLRGKTPWKIIISAVAGIIAALICWVWIVPKIRQIATEPWPEGYTFNLNNFYKKKDNVVIGKKGSDISLKSDRYAYQDLARIDREEEHDEKTYTLIALQEEPVKIQNKRVKGGERQKLTSGSRIKVSDYEFEFLVEEEEGEETPRLVVKQNPRTVKEEEVK